MHGSKSKAGPGVFGPYSVPREAGKNNRHHGEYYLWSLHQRAESGLGAGNPGCNKRLLTGVGKSKPTLICPYLLHLYIAHDMVQADDKKVYMVGESFMRHEVDPDEEEESSGSESLEQESLTSKEIRELQQQKEKKEASLPRRKVTPTFARKDKGPQEEERAEEPQRKNPFQVIADSLNEIQERCGQTRKMVLSACAVVGAEGEHTLVETLKELLRQIVLDLENRNAKLKEEMKKLKEELEDERKVNSIGATKLGESMELIRKMEGVVQQPANTLNKAKLFDAGLAKNPVTAANVIPVLIDFNQKMDEILMDMQALFEGLEVSGLVPLDQVPNISINTEELPTVHGWNSGSQAQTPTPTKPVATSRPTPRQE